MTDTAAFSNSVSDVDVVLGTGRMEVTSSLFQMYRDSNNVFTVIPESHTIFRTDARGAEKHGLSDMAWMRDTLIARSQIVECTDLHDSGRVDGRRVRLMPDPAARQYFGIGSMTVLLDLTRNEVRSIEIEPLDKGMYAKLTWRFSPLKYSTQTQSQTVAQRFLDGGALRHEWNGYKVVDNRSLAISDTGN
jgi:hypothetical protein